MDSRRDSYPSVIKITKAGWIYIVLTIFLGIAAVNTGNNLLFFIVSAFLSFMGISGFFGKINISKLELDITFPDEVFANREFFVEINIKNKKRFLPIFLLNILVDGKKALIPYGEKNGNTKLKYIINSRGLYKTDKVKICSVFPFNFFVRCFSYKVNVKKVIYPEPKNLDIFQYYYPIDKTKKHSEGKTLEKQGFEGDFLGIRDYTEGTPIKYIDWKASTKSEKMKEKILSTITSEPTIIEFEKLQINVEDKLSYITYLVVNYKRYENLYISLEKVLYDIKDKSNREKLLYKLALYGLKDEDIS